MSSESPRIGRATGDTEAAAHTSAMAAIAIRFRVLRRILKPEYFSGRQDPARLFHPQQPADDRRRTGPRLFVDAEDDLRRLEAGGIDAARRQRDVLCGEIDEASL